MGIEDVRLIGIKGIGGGGKTTLVRAVFDNICFSFEGWKKDKAIRALESCGFHARNGLRVLEQKSLIAISPNMELGMHDHIEEMGQNIARHSDPNEPIRHNRLWIRGEIEDVFAKDLSADVKKQTCFLLWTVVVCSTSSTTEDCREVTRTIAIQINSSGDNECPCYEILTNGFGNMKNLRFLHVDSDTRDWPVNIRVGQNLPNALRFLSWRRFPHCSLPKTFQANNLVSLQISSSIIIQLWEDGERKVLKNLKFLDFSYSHLRTLDCGLLPNLEKLNLAKGNFTISIVTFSLKEIACTIFRQTLYLYAIAISLLISTVARPLHPLRHPVASNSKMVTCGCGNEAMEITSWTNQNPGRQFWNCTRCGFL
ncbi:unnamed protein product [Lactuca saligna]|uniref:Disease resistance protein Roq1-like winged-helix domain-containing protein n=1 Tax=Lactuca saligna TaxID=75948 RepID=A0AA35Y8D2_LACSI|nr:unnamed protein product [Lactuca saligna]